MLVKLLPEQVANYWEDLIKEGIRVSLPLHVARDDDAMNSILGQILKGNIQCWVVKNESQIIAIATTAIMKDDLTGSSSLLIYSVTTLSHMAEDFWKEGYEAFTKFARGVGCNRVYAYTTDERVVAMAKLNGAEFQTLCSFPLL